MSEALNRRAVFSGVVPEQNASVVYTSGRVRYPVRVLDVECCARLQKQNFDIPLFIIFAQESTLRKKSRRAKV